MTALAVVDGGRTAVAETHSHNSLVEILARAKAAIYAAQSAAELLDGSDVSDFVYDSAKHMARLARKMGAHDDVVAKSHRLQADALEMKSVASILLANAYDEAQRNGTVAPHGGAYNVDIRVVDIDRTNAALGIDARKISEARKVRDSVGGNEEVIREVLGEILDKGHEPTKAALSREINTRLNSFSGDNEWYTPARYIEMAREVMGSIDVDPASNATAQAVVRAKSHYTAETNGLDKDWRGKVWMNPPYSNPEIQNFVEHLLVQISNGNVTEAIVLTNNSADTGWHHDLQGACSRLCLTKGRIRFESPTRASNSPAMGQSFFYFGDSPERFRDVFSKIGTVWVMA